VAVQVIQLLTPQLVTQVLLLRVKLTAQVVQLLGTLQVVQLVMLQVGWQEALVVVVALIKLYPGTQVAQTLLGQVAHPLGQAEQELLLLM
jgi:hypothetical protein